MKLLKTYCHSKNCEGKWQHSTGGFCGKNCDFFAGKRGFLLIRFLIGPAEENVLRD